MSPAHTANPMSGRTEVPSRWVWLQTGHCHMGPLLCADCLAHGATQGARVIGLFLRREPFCG